MSAHRHGHAGHCHHDHSHEISDDADFRKLSIVLGLLVGFMVVEILIGILAHSLALWSDAGHMLTDAGGIIMSMGCIWINRRSTTEDMPYGLKRVKILSALVNGITLLVLGAIILYNAVDRLISPPEVHGNMVLYVALLGIAVNYLAVRILAQANREDLNIEGSFQHMLTDMYAFIGTAVAGLVILLTGFDRADPILSLGVGLLMFRSAKPLILKSGRIFLQMAPAGLTPKVRVVIVSYPGVNQVSDLQIWSLTSDDHYLSAHVVVNDGVDGSTVCHELGALVAEKFGINNVTVQPHYLAA